MAMAENDAATLDWLPMQRSRTEGWAAMRGLGDVFAVQGAWFVTGPEPVEFALKHPAPIVPRVTTTDVELGGQTLPAGSPVQVAGLDHLPLVLGKAQNQ